MLDIERRLLVSLNSNTRRACCLPSLSGGHFKASRISLIGWDQCYHNFRVDDEYNNGHRLEYPVIARPHLKWMKDAHCKIGDVMILYSNESNDMILYSNDIFEQ